MPGIDPSARYLGSRSSQKFPTRNDSVAGVGECLVFCLGERLGCRDSGSRHLACPSRRVGARQRSSRSFSVPSTPLRCYLTFQIPWWPGLVHAFPPCFISKSSQNIDPSLVRVTALNSRGVEVHSFPRSISSVSRNAMGPTVGFCSNKN